MAKNNLDQLLRVDHAGEYGAVRIYQGQQAVLKNSEIGPQLQHMMDQELQHKKKFEDLMIVHRVRPTVLSPLWHLAGYALGYGSALLGKKAAMACTVAVEEVIEEHYQEQLRELEAAPTAPEVKSTIEHCLAEEIDHKDRGIQYGAADMQGYTLFTSAIKKATRLAIWLSKRV